MPEFSEIIYGFVNIIIKSEPIIIFPFFIATIIGIFSYFGFFYNFYRPKLPEKTFMNFQGMLFTFGYFLAFFWFTQTLIFPILLDQELIISGVILTLLIYYFFDVKISLVLIFILITISFIENNYFSFLTGNQITSAIILIVTFVYITLIMFAILRKCDAAENSLEYKGLFELDMLSEYLSLEELQNIIVKNNNINNDKSLISYFGKMGNIFWDIAKEIKNQNNIYEISRLLVDFIIFGPPKLIILLILSYLIFQINNLSFILGILTFSYIFIVLTLISMEKGISSNIFRYARVRLRRDSNSTGPKTMEGRIKRIDKESVQLLVRHSDSSTHWEYIPMDYIINIELIKKPKSFGK